MGEVVRMSDIKEAQVPAQPKKSQMVTMDQIPDRGTVEQRQILKNLNRKIYQVLKKDQWKGQRCFIIGGGESVKNFDLRKLKNENVIAVNMAFRLVEPSIIYCMDARLWGWIENDETGPIDSRKFNESKAIKVFSDTTPAPLPEDIVIAPAMAGPGLSRDIKELGVGTNSGFGALNLALILGASEIYLIGYDFCGTRWHAGYPQPSEVTNEYHLQCFKESSEGFKEFKNSKIINLNRDSKLDIFEFGDMPEDAGTLEPQGEGGQSAGPKRTRSKKDPVFVSYYTVDNGYDEYGKNLIKTLELADVEFDVQAVKSKGKWDLDTKIKPAFIKKMKERYPGRALIWIDADAVMVKFPEELYKITKTDVAVPYYKDGKELVSNLVYFATTKAADKVLEKWYEACKDPKNESVWDQILLQKILEGDKKVRVKVLPPEYCYIMGHPNTPDVKPIIEQHQASRKLKR